MKFTLNQMMILNLDMKLFFPTSGASSSSFLAPPVSAGLDPQHGGHGGQGGSRVRSRSVGDEELNQSARTLGGAGEDGGGQVSKGQN